VLVAGALLVLAGTLSFVMPAYAFYVFSAAALVALFPLARKALMSAIAGQPFTIETLVTIAVIGAIIIDEAAEAAVVVFLFLIGEMLEMLAAAKARRSVQALADLVPKTAFLVSSSGVTEVAADTLAVGDLVEIRPGGRIPADGAITQGETSIDESAVTGESIPKRKEPGDGVFAGSINADRLIRIRVEKGAENNMIARILQMVEEAEASKAPTARFIDRFSRYYTPGVIVVSALIAFVPPLFFGGDWTLWTYKGLAILLIGCPCALVLSTPAAITSGISSGARQGLLMKGGAVLEAIGKATLIAFDKTGTLTEGTPKVTDIRTFSGEEKNLLTLAGAVEAGSSHPLAVAIVDEVKKRGVKIVEATGSEALSGRGVRAQVDGRDVIVASPRYAAKIAKLSKQQNDEIRALEEEGKTVAVVVADKTALGIFALRDELRDDAVDAMRELDGLNVEAVMLTGDNARTGAALASQLGIKVQAELLPQDKLEAIEKLKEEFNVAMVGDGINDAPALARADVGIAMGGGTDVALETADAALLHERVGDVPALISLSRATMANIHQNITIALGLKAVFLVTTMMGVTTLWMAILADTGATVLVTLNALRLLKHRFS
ncbi:MAG TPA: cadmium-translocating P-type ATPase, partial [Rhizobiales bacterium]|nr:cadmium-translocating P-type ATPase [Hyphomicrobiales bacterium]